MSKDTLPKEAFSTHLGDYYLTSHYTRQLEFSGTTIPNLNFVKPDHFCG
jgi:hypothetical protein